MDGGIGGGRYKSGTEEAFKYTRGYAKNGGNGGYRSYVDRGD